jgi:hypothetical protein
MDMMAGNGLMKKYSVLDSAAETPVWKNCETLDRFGDPYGSTSCLLPRFGAAAQ